MCSSMKIVRSHVVPYAAAISDSFLLKHENTKLLTAGLVENMIETEMIEHRE